MSRLVTDHLPLLAGAPNGVKKLRELILELAVRGKIVPQNSDDESARSFLRAVGPDIDFHPHDLPNGWIWTSFGKICQIRTELVRPEDYFDSQQVAPDCIEKGTGRLIHSRTVKESGVRGPNSLFRSGQILYSKIRPSLSKVVLIDFDGLCSADMYPIDSHIYPRFQLQLMLSEFFLTQVRVAENRVKMPKLNQESLNAFVVPVPPLAEQHRIVAKVDELMALCDRLETRQSDAQAAHARLVDELLGSLLQARDAEDFQSCWQLLAENFQTVFTTEASVDALQSVVFGLAARGLLTRQNEADEQSSQLLERIAQHKQVRGKSTSRQQTLQEGNLATAGDVPFPLPNSWCWARWNDVALKIGDIDHKMPTPDPAGVPFVSPRDFYPGNVIDFEGAKRVSRSDFERLSAKIRAECDDLIYPRYGTIGENVLVTVDRDFLVSYSCAVIKVAKGFVEPRYQFYVSLSDCIRKQAKAAENKTTQANVGIKSIQNFFFPLPPHTEQVRIVAKVNELLALCDRLKARIRQARQVQERLAGTLVERAVL